MVQKPVEWRRFEPVELPEQRRPSLKPILLEPPASEVDAFLLMRVFERALQDNDRLQAECASLRTELRRRAEAPLQPESPAAPAPSESTSDEGDPMARAMRRLRADVERILERHDAAAGKAAQESTSRVETGAAGPAAAEHESALSALEYLARIVAEWIWAEPTPPQVRLVKDALCARGIREVLTDVGRVRP
jgi:hypothetical protein